MNTLTKGALLYAALILTSLAGANAQTVPNVFTPNAPALAEDVNANFSSLDSRLNGHIGDAAAHSDMLGGLVCAAGQVAAWSGTAWSCEANVLTEAQVDALVANNGYQPQFKRIFVVPGGTDIALNGTNLLNAIASLPGTAVASPLLVFVEPGTYFTSSVAVTIPDNVAVAGSGRGVTRINAPIVMGTNTEIRELSAVVHGLSVTGTDVRIRNVNVDLFGLSGIAILADTPGSGPVLIENVRIEMSGSTDAIGVFAVGLVGITLKNVDVTASATTGVAALFFSNTPFSVLGGSIDASGGIDPNDGVQLAGSAVGLIRRLQITASGANSHAVNLLTGASASVEIHGSSLAGTTNAIVVSTSSSANIATSQLVGPVNATGAIKCVHSYNDLFDPLTAACVP